MGKKKAFLTRKQVADLLGIGVTSVRRAEGRYLHPTIDRWGVRRFSPIEVEAFSQMKGRPAHQEESDAASVAASKVPGPVAAKIFMLFEQNRSLVQVVLETEQNPIVVREFRRLYDTERLKIRRIESERAKEEYSAARDEWDRELEQERAAGKKK